MGNPDSNTTEKLIQCYRKTNRLKSYHSFCAMIKLQLNVTDNDYSKESGTQNRHKMSDGNKCCNITHGNTCNSL